MHYAAWDVQYIAGVKRKFIDDFPMLILGRIELLRFDRDRDSAFVNAPVF